MSFNTGVFLTCSGTVNSAKLLSAIVVVSEVDSAGFRELSFTKVSWKEVAKRSFSLFAHCSIMFSMS